MSADKYLDDKPMSESKSFVPLVVILVILSVVLFAFVAVKRASAIFIPKTYVCHCEQPDSGSPFQCQTLHITIPSAIAHLAQHDADYSGQCQVDPSPTPTPTVEPSVTPEPTPEVTPTPERLPDQPLSQAGAGPAPSCSDPKPAVLPWNFHVIRKGDTAELYWIPGDANTADILYRENHVADWVHSLTIRPNIGRATVRDLVPSESYTFALRERNACSDGTIITPVVVDPPALNRLFPTTYWLVW